MDKPGLIVICGPTATGKSAVAIALAQRLNSVILSADSRQVYREFNIGTAKPTELECQGVPHYLMDICDPGENFTLAEYQQQAQALIVHFHQRGTTPLLVGGTGLYIQSITQGLKIPRVAPQPELRSQLAAQGQGQLYQWLQQVDPVSGQRIHAHDQVRTLRALEAYYVTGIPLSQQQGKQPPDYPILQIGLDCDDGSASAKRNQNALTLRIRQRTEQMLAAGWLAEVEVLVHKYGSNLPLLNTLGYQELKQHLAGEISLTQAVELTVLHTRQFAKRQRTWFRAEPTIHWLDCNDPQVREKVYRVVEH